MANAADFGVLQLLSDEDLAPMIAVWLRPVAASHLRAVCSVANAALTSTQWAASQWKEWRLGLLSSWQREKLVFYAMIDVGETGTPQRTILRFEGKFLHIENFFGDFYSLAIDVDSSTLSVSGTSKQDTSLEIAGHWVDAGFQDSDEEPEEEMSPPPSPRSAAVRDAFEAHCVPVGDAKLCVLRG